MGQRHKETSKRRKRRRDRSSVRGANSRDAGKRGDSLLGAWFQGKRPIYWFAILFGAMVIPLNIYYYASFSKTGVFQGYLGINARASASIMRIFGTEATAIGDSISSPAPGSGLSIAMGCDAIQPSILFLCAVLASPVSLRSKLPGVLLGVPILLVLNVVRIITLFYTQIYVPSLFELMHIDVWQALFIILAMVFWVIWAGWAKRATAPIAEG